MRASILNTALGALGLAAVALSAPSDDESSVCVAPSTNTIFITVPQSYSTIYITVPATLQAPVTTQYSTLQSIVYFTSPFPTQQPSVSSEASSSIAGTSTTSYDTTVTESPPAVTVTQIWSKSIPAIVEDSSTAGYSFIVNSGTTSWVDDHTPTLTGPVVIKTSSITVSPVSILPLETSTLTLHITVKSTSQLTVTKTLPVPTQGSYTGLASGGWNSTGSSIFSGAKGATAGSTPSSRSALNEPLTAIPSGLDQTDSVATSLAAQSGFRVESSSIPIVCTTDNSHALSTINIYHSSYAVISETSFAAEAGFQTGLTSLSLAPLPTSTASSTSVLAQISTQSRQYTLSTVYSTSEITVTSCHATVTDCPAGPHTETITIAVSTTWCPVEATQTSSAVTNTATFPSGLSLASPTSGAPWTNSTSGLAPSTSTTIASISSTSQGVVTTFSSPISVTQWTTSTVYTTSEITVTSCASSVTNCPAGPHVTTITIPLYTTICPVTATQPAQTTNATVSGHSSWISTSVAPWANSSSLADGSSVQGISTFTASLGLTTGFPSMPTANTTAISISSTSGASTSGLGDHTWPSTNLSSLSSEMLTSSVTGSSSNITTAPSGAIGTSAMTTCSDDGWNSTQSTMIHDPTATSTAQSSVSMSTSASSQNSSASILSSITVASPISSSQDFSTVSSVAPIITTAPVLNYTSSYVSSISPSQLAPNTTLSYDSTLSSIISSVSISQVQSYDSTLSPILSSASLPQVQSSTPGLITSVTPTSTRASSSLAGNRTSTIQSATPSSCGEVGDFTLHFDDAPVNPNSSGAEPHPVFNPYHQFDFSDGFTVVPYPIDPYQPSSGSQLIEFIPFYNINGTNDQAGPNTAELGYTGQISDGDNYQTGCFKFNVYGATFGCNSTGPTCDVTITGWSYDISTSTPTLVSSQELSIPACTTFANDDQSCSLVPVNLEDTFKNLSFVQFNVTVALVPQVWYMDDLRVGWFDNSCAKGLCRQQTHVQ